MADIPLSPTYRAADALELELAFGDDNELAFGSVLALAEEGNEDKHGGTENGTAENDKLENLIREVFRHLSYRTQTFGSAYPFTIQISHGLERLVLVEKLDSDKLLYRFLLACSHLNKYTKAERQSLADIFEEVCVHAAAAYLNGEAVRFGADARKKESRFVPKLKDALLQLAEYLNAMPNEASIKMLKQNNTGDAKIDIVARVPFPSNDLFGMLTALGQCTCSESGWSKKVQEARYDSYLSQFMTVRHPPANLFFIPFFMRDSSGKFDNEPLLFQCIPLDRLRICRLLDGKVSGDLAKEMSNFLDGAKPQLIGHAA